MGRGRYLIECGFSIKSDAQNMVSVPLGDVIMTTAGTLKHQKYVYHCKYRLTSTARQLRSKKAYSRSLRASNRDDDPPKFFRHNVGFRVAKDI